MRQLRLFLNVNIYSHDLECIYLSECSSSSDKPKSSDYFFSAMAAWAAFSPSTFISVPSVAIRRSLISRLHLVSSCLCYYVKKIRNHAVVEEVVSKSDRSRFLLYPKKRFIFLSDLFHHFIKTVLLNGYIIFPLDRSEC